MYNIGRAEFTVFKYRYKIVWPLSVQKVLFFWHTREGAVFLVLKRVLLSQCNKQTRLLFFQGERERGRAREGEKKLGERSGGMKVDKALPLLRAV